MQKGELVFTKTLMEFDFWGFMDRDNMKKWDISGQIYLVHLVIY